MQDIDALWAGEKGNFAVVPELLSDRNLEAVAFYSTQPTLPGANLIDLGAISGNGKAQFNAGRIEMSFHGESGVHELRFKLPDPQLGNGLSARFRLRQWKELNYIAVGYTHETTLRNVRISNPVRDRWIDFSIGHGDIAFGLQNAWNCPTPEMISDIRLYIKGKPDGTGAFLDIECLACWREDLTGYPVIMPKASAKTAEKAIGRSTPISAELKDLIYDYFIKRFASAENQAKDFLATGSCPLSGEIALSWPAEQALPTDLASIGSYSYSWHALHPAIFLMIYARQKKELSALFAAREFVNNWLERSYFKPDEDKKFTWYDHGAAERLLALVMIWAEGLEQNFDHRFMTRLRSVIFRHGQLLESELFYASHQPTRYHNHAWFQDMALMATALAISDFPCSSRWMETALARLTDQFDRLIVRDCGFAVFLENSIGYHCGIQKLVEFAGTLIAFSGKDSPVRKVAKELTNFSKLMRYPDNRTPAQGDTFRSGNPSGSGICRPKPYRKPEFIVMPEAGYGFVKANDGDTPFMLTVLATSLCSTHKHEDNLSFTLFFDGLEWLTDPSFYSHAYASPIPSYLRSAAAHNALAIPQMSYSIEPGTASLKGELSGNEFVIAGEHSAYDGVLIEREIRGRLNRLELDIFDLAKTDASPTCELFLMLQCGEGVEIELNGSNLMLSHADSKFNLFLTLPGTDCRNYKGFSKGNMIRGIAGLGFLNQSEIHTIECRVPFNTPLHWNLKVFRK